MNAHSQASEDSKALCDKLLAELREIIPNLQRSFTKNWCVLYQTGRTRFLYVAHSKTRAQIVVWCRGDIDKLLDNDPGLGLCPRKNWNGGWAKDFPVHFYIHDTQEIPKVAEFLERVSYRASSQK